MSTKWPQLSAASWWPGSETSETTEDMDVLLDCRRGLLQWLLVLVLVAVVPVVRLSLRRHPLAKRPLDEDEANEESFEDWPCKDLRFKLFIMIPGILAFAFCSSSSWEMFQRKVSLRMLWLENNELNSEGKRQRCAWSFPRSLLEHVFILSTFPSFKFKKGNIKNNQLQ